MAASRLSRLPATRSSVVRYLASGDGAPITVADAAIIGAPYPTYAGLVCVPAEGVFPMSVSDGFVLYTGNIVRHLRTGKQIRPHFRRIFLRRFWGLLV